MRYQRKNYWCGIASIANALECVGTKMTQREIARLCNVTAAEGTSETEMKRALMAVGFLYLDEASFSELEPAMGWLTAKLHNGPTILCVDDDEHWVTALGLCDRRRFIIFDPARNHGVEIHSWGTLAARWKNADNIYYGIGL